MCLFPKNCSKNNLTTAFLSLYITIINFQLRKFITNKFSQAARLPQKPLSEPKRLSHPQRPILTQQLVEVFDPRSLLLRRLRLEI
mmetsp:Transcript_45065/g.88474  ORF Transcript_45065/g.88474 Transcript_45065/m.88474 type:complete len:85 (+) Transcript_45065:355-609(+)